LDGKQADMFSCYLKAGMSVNEYKKRLSFEKSPLETIGRLTGFLIKKGKKTLLLKYRHCIPTLFVLYF
jgi:hypothetical protein